MMTPTKQIGCSAVVEGKTVIVGEFVTYTGPKLASLTPGKAYQVYRIWPGKGRIRAQFDVIDDSDMANGLAQEFFEVAQGEF